MTDIYCGDFRCDDFRRGDFCVSTDPSRLDRAMIYRALAGSYWAAERPTAIIDRSLEHSLVFGLYHGDTQIGLARVVTDYATFAWICDVVVDDAWRGQGLGTWLMECVTDHPQLRGLRRQLLATHDAHEIYRRVGFVPLAVPERWMEKRA